MWPQTSLTSIHAIAFSTTAFRCCQNRATVLAQNVAGHTKESESEIKQVFSGPPVLGSSAKRGKSRLKTNRPEANRTLDFQA